MKKGVSITLVGLYLLLSVGIQVLVHTCGGYRTYDVMPVSAEDPCGCGDESPLDRCCTVEVRSMQLSDMHIGKPAATSESFSQALATLIPANVAFEGRGQDTCPPIDTSPPSSVPPNILFCTFLI